MTRVWALQRELSRNLLLWSALSIVTGAALLFTVPFWRGVGVQGVVWGVIDAAIAFFGLASLRRRRRRADADQPDTLRREARNLRRLLLINSGLDLLYIVVGVIVLREFANPFARGNGLGIIVQGTFLLLFDTFYAYRVQAEGKVAA